MSHNSTFLTYRNQLFIFVCFCLVTLCVHSASFLPSLAAYLPLSLPPSLPSTHPSLYPSIHLSFISVWRTVEVTENVLCYIMLVLLHFMVRCQSLDVSPTGMQKYSQGQYKPKCKEVYCQISSTPP